MVYRKKPTIARRPYKRVARKPRVNASKNLTALIKKVSLRQCETKTGGFQASGISLYHNQTYYKGGLLHSHQADGDPNGFGSGNMNAERIGDEIVLRGMSFRFYHETAASRPNVVTKIFIFKHRSGQAPSDANFWCGSNGLGSSMIRLLDYPNTEKINVLKTMTIQHQPNYANTDGVAQLNRICGTYRQCYINFKDTKIKFEGDGSTFPKLRDIGVAVVSFDANGTLITDLIGYLNYSVRMYYKDP